MSMLKGFFGGVSQPQDQTTPKASDQKNPFDLLSSITPSRRASQAGLPQQQPPTTTPSQQQQLQSGLKTPTLQPRTSYSGSSTPGSDGGLITPGASGSVPGTPGGRALATTGEYNSYSYRHQASRGGMDRLLNGLFGSQLERSCGFWSEHSRRSLLSFPFSADQTSLLSRSLITSLQSIDPNELYS